MPDVPMNDYSIRKLQAHFFMEPSAHPKPIKVPLLGLPTPPHQLHSMRC